MFLLSDKKTRFHGMLHSFEREHLARRSILSSPASPQSDNIHIDHPQSVSRQIALTEPQRNLCEVHDEDRGVLRSHRHATNLAGVGDKGLLDRLRPGTEDLIVARHVEVEPLCDRPGAISRSTAAMTGMSRHMVGNLGGFGGHPRPSDRTQWAPPSSTKRSKPGAAHAPSALVAAHPGHHPRCKAGFGSRSRRIDPCRWMGKRAGSEGRRNEKAPISRSFLQRLAERVGFEPTEGLTLRRFSRPVP